MGFSYALFSNMFIMLIRHIISMMIFFEQKTLIRVYLE